MIFSKPLYNFLGFYFEQLFNHPLRTKAITSCVIATAANLASQYIEGRKEIDQNSLFAYGVFGLLFGGTIPHYFYKILERLVPEEASFAVIKKILLERLIFTPLFQAFVLYTLARLEGKSHNAAINQLMILYIPMLLAVWKYLTVVQIINFTVVPPMLRVLLMNVVGFLWIIYLTKKRRRQEAKSK
ncbi:Mpv17 / PMP22 family [Popillia japonica]|uniref:Mpv17 / PMP22 family n=1 Tax=Popillia japonica TaxID=7064 RepID=A0AAW1MI87_POPJA